MYRVVFHTHFKKKLKKLPQKIREQFYERLNIFVENPWYPLLNNHSVHAIYPGRRSINVTGDYRALFREFEDEIMFTDIDTHSELYG